MDRWPEHRWGWVLYIQVLRFKKRVNILEWVGLGMVRIVWGQMLRNWTQVCGVLSTISSAAISGCCLRLDRSGRDVVYNAMKVYPRVLHKWNTDACWTLVWPVFNTQSLVFHLKILFFDSNTCQTQLDMARTNVEHGSDVRRTRLDTARMRSEHNLVLFFNYLMD